MIFLHLESFENKRFELDFSIFQKPCFYGQAPPPGSPPRKVNFFHGYDIYFFKILAPFRIQKNF